LEGHPTAPFLHLRKQVRGFTPFGFCPPYSGLPEIRPFINKLSTIVQAFHKFVYPQYLEISKHSIFCDGDNKFTKRTGVILLKLHRGVKIAIIGVGQVGASAAFAILSSGMASDLVLVDANKEKAEGEAMDLGDAAAFVKPINMFAGTYQDCRGADIVIFTAGASQKPGETRLDLVQKNIVILKQSLPELLKYCSDSILLMVANPVDVLTYAALRISGLPANRVFGTGTVLDTSRYKAELAEYCRVDPRNVHAYIVGEHGDSEVALWSFANVAGVAVEEFCRLKGLSPLNRNEITERVRTAAYEIIQRKGATFYAVALAIKRICEAVLRDENSILTVSGLVDNLYGIKDCCLSLPTIVNGEGRSKVIALPMSVEEEKALRNSAGVLKKIIQQAGF